MDEFNSVLLYLLPAATLLLIALALLRFAAHRVVQRGARGRNFGILEQEAEIIGNKAGNEEAGKVEKEFEDFEVMEKSL
jgi:hypothetical protein